MRAAGVLLLALLALPATALADEPLELDSLQRILVPGAGDAGPAQPVQLLAQPAAPAQDQAAQAAPAAPVAAVAQAADGALLWFLAAGSAGAGLVGWRQLSLRNALDHPGRAAILALLRRQPGLHVRGIARELGMPAQHAAYHLRILEKLGLVRSLEAGGKRCYHEAGLAQPTRDALLRAALAPSMAQRQVLAFVTLHPGASQSEVARQLGMLQGAARWHLQRLVRCGMLTEQRAGKALAYRVPELSSSPGR